MDIKATREALAEIARGVDDPSGGKLNAYARPENQMVGPAFVVGTWRRITGEDVFGGQFIVEFTCWLIIEAQPPVEAQMRMDILLSSGEGFTAENSLYMALWDQMMPNGERSLGGRVPAMIVGDIDTTRTFKIGTKVFYASSIKVRVDGDRFVN